MTKLTEEDLALWNLYKLNFKTVSKKIENYKIKSFDEKKKIVSFSKQEFTLEKKLIKSLEKNQVKIDHTLDLHGLTQTEAKNR